MPSDVVFSVVVIDTPSVKQFVFGTDSLAEIRGASAILDELNQTDTEQVLREQLARFGGRLDKVYANGGSAQFIVYNCAPNQIHETLTVLARVYREKTGGEVRIATGIGACDRADGYRQAVRLAHFRMRAHREMGTACTTVNLLPFVKECQSASHLPASRAMQRGDDDTQFLSDASRLKQTSARRSRRFGVWYSWMQSLAKAGPWPAEAQWDNLRCDDFAIIGQASERSGYIGLVYADGNAMGRLVQELDAAETCQGFSDLVDSSIRNACFRALEAVLKSEADDIRRSVALGLRPKPVPADILLLGGDDLMVVLPADRALSFALIISEHFERLTQEAIAKQSGACRKFFQDRLKGRGLTISCGVAVGRANYPFYLLLNLAEELLQNAKRAGHAARQKHDTYAMPSFLDFHVVGGAASHELKHVRENDYFTETNQSRSLRPLSHGQLLALQQAVAQLRRVRFPRSKLHDLFEAALDPSPSRAEHRLREIFSRCRDTERQPERWSLWQAVARMSPRHDVSNFPWLDQAGKRVTPLADIVEAYDLFPSKEEA